MEAIKWGRRFRGTSISCNTANAWPNRGASRRGIPLPARACRISIVLYLDANTDTYVTFGTNNSGTPLPPSTTTNYSQEIITYAREYVVPADQDRVIYEMTLPRVIEQLDLYGVHSFTCGMNEPILGYRRKRVEYRYYDQARKIILLSRTDVTAIYQEQQRLLVQLQDALQKAQTDFLTGLFNHQGFIDHVTTALARQEAPAALLFLDIDNFKSINDSFGHQVGDDVITQVGRILRKQLGPADYAGRLGGDEFILFLQHLTSVDEAVRCAKQLGQDIQQIVVVPNVEHPVSCSIGIALAPQDGTSYKELFKAADDLLYKAKGKGKNCYALHSEQETP